MASSIGYGFKARTVATIILTDNNRRLPGWKLHLQYGFMRA
jgi:hypothetical protein